MIVASSVGSRVACLSRREAVAISISPEALTCTVVPVRRLLISRPPSIMAAPPVADRAAVGHHARGSAGREHAPRPGWSGATRAIRLAGTARARISGNGDRTSVAPQRGARMHLNLIRRPAGGGTVPSMYRELEDHPHRGAGPGADDQRTHHRGPVKRAALSLHTRRVRLGGRQPVRESAVQGGGVQAAASRRHTGAPPSHTGRDRGRGRGRVGDRCERVGVDAGAVARAASLRQGACAAAVPRATGAPPPAVVSSACAVLRRAQTAADLPRTRTTLVSSISGRLSAYDPPRGASPDDDPRERGGISSAVRR